MTEEQVAERVAEWREELGDGLSEVDSEEQILNILSRLDVDSIRELVVEDGGRVSDIRREIRDAWSGVPLDRRQARTTARLLMGHFRGECMPVGCHAPAPHAWCILCCIDCSLMPYV